jgi:hypothetical protein
MPMTAERRRTAVALCVAGLGLTVGAAAYVVSFHLTAPRTVPITLAGCLGFGVATVEIPLEALHVGTSALPISFGPISFGPIELPGGGGAIHLHFHAVASPSGDGVQGAQGEVVRSGDMVILPLTFGRDGALPDRIDLKCRDGKLTGIRYRREGNSQTFRVINDQGKAVE